MDHRVVLRIYPRCDQKTAISGSSDNRLLLCVASGPQSLHLCRTTRLMGSSGLGTRGVHPGLNLVGELLNHELDYLVNE
jgi:hypothetical protein